MFNQIRPSMYGKRQIGLKPKGKVKLGLYRDHRGAQPAVLISDDVVNGLGWHTGDRFMLLVGAGSEEGKILIVPQHDGYVLGQHTPRGTTRIVRFPPTNNKGISNVPHISETVEYEVVGDRLSITCPSWFLSQPVTPSQANVADIKCCSAWCCTTPSTAVDEDATVDKAHESEGELRGYWNDLRKQEIERHAIQNRIANALEEIAASMKYRD